MEDHSEGPVLLARDCTAIQIPYGNKITARAGTHLQVVQRLGDGITVRTDHGYLLRIEESDHDALGLAAAQPDGPDPTLAGAPGEPIAEADCWEALRSCYDPEIPANIVDLGLIYRCSPLTMPDGRQRVEVDMTLTAPGCGMGQVLQDDVQRKLMGLSNVCQVDVSLTFDPPWEPAMMSEGARLQLGMF